MSEAARIAETSLTQLEAERTLSLEAEMLDDRRYDEWLDLFTPEAFYWIPVAYRPNEQGDPADQLNHIYDDAERRSERVWRLLNTPVLDQHPPSRTVHFVTNVRVDPEPVAASTYRVRCNQMITEMRAGGIDQVGLNSARVFSARCEYHFVDVGSTWKFGLKRVSLINSDQPLFNLTFIV